MSLDRPIVRLLAAMILAIIAYAAPSAVQAHAGHGHHGAATPPGAAEPAPQAAAPSVSGAPMVASERVAARTAPIAPTRDDGCRPGCGTRCCKTMACCATGILSESSLVAPSLFRTATLIPRDMSHRAGTDPEALPEPPRTLA